MNCLITGATGFVGSNLCKRLVKQGWNVRILRRSSSDLSLLSGLEVEHKIGDVTDLKSTVEACDGVDVVFHLAGVIGYTKEMRGLMEKVNVGGTENVLVGCREAKVKRLIYMSSVVAIGAGFTPQEVLNEESEYNIAHLDLGYFQTKHNAENIVKKFCKKNELTSVILNPSTIYGPGDATKGSRKVQLKVAKGKFPFYPPGGVNIVHIDDVLHCLLSAVENGQINERHIIAGDNLLLKKVFEIIAETAKVEAPRIGLNKFAIRSIASLDSLLKVFGFKGPINSETAWTSQLYHYFDSSKAQKIFGFTPKPARSAIQESILWSQKNGLL